MSEYRNTLLKKQGELAVLLKRQSEAISMLETVKQRSTIDLQAKEVLNEVMLGTQQKLSGFIEDVVTLALKATFGEEYAFKVEYEIKRGKSEANLYVVKNGDRFVPEDECGGGVLDVTALGLRVALWSLAKTKPEPILILDEPGKFLSVDKMEAFGNILKTFSEMFGIQIILVTHSEQLATMADRTFVVSQKDGLSKVEVA